MTIHIQWGATLPPCTLQQKSSFTISTSGHHCLQEAHAYQPVSTLPSQHPTQVKRGAPRQGLDHQHVEQASEEVNHASSQGE